MHVSLREDGLPFQPEEFFSISDDEALGEWAELVVHSHIEDSEVRFSDREINGLIAWEQKESTKRQALFEVCVALSKETELPKKLKEWLEDYTNTKNIPLTGRGKCPQRMYRTAILAEAIGVAIRCAELHE